MEIRISDELHEIIRYSRDEALRTGCYAITADHLLLGLLRQGSNKARAALADLGTDLDELKEYIDSRIFTNASIPFSEADKVTFSRSSQNLLSITVLETTKAGSGEAGAVHLLLALARTSESCFLDYIKSCGTDYSRIHAYLRDEGLLAPESRESAWPGKEEAGKDQGEKAKEEQFSLEDFGVDLTLAAAQGKLDPVVGRESEIARLTEVLGRRKKNNPMLLGEPGVGKSAIVEGLAQRIARGEITPVLAKKHIFSLDIASVVAGTRYRGDFEKRLKSIIKEAGSNPDIILFIDEFHTVVGAGGAQGSLDAANILKPALARGGVQCIGATTMDEFVKIVEKDGALDRRFQKIVVEATGVEKSVSILQSIKSTYESFHNVVYSDQAVQACVRLTDRYVADRALPDKAVDALDESGSLVRLELAGGKRRSEVVGEEDVAAVVSKMSGVPVTKVAQTEGGRLLAMPERLRSRLIGQDQAIDKVVRAIRRNRAGIKDPRRPIGTFLFFGPTGVGKTELAKRLAEYLFDSEDNLVRIDMSEYQEKHTVSRLVGAPPGYVGHEDGGQLSEKVRRKPYCVVLLDEIEKAHPDIFNVLLQVLDDGRLTDSNGRTVDFKNTIVIMTSNAGSRDLDDYGKGLGFATSGKDVEASRQGVLERAVKRSFPPEFIGRVDERVFFNPLTKDDLVKIVDIEIKGLKERVAEQGWSLSVTPSAKRFIADSGFDPAFGARPIKKAVRRFVEDPVSEFIISDKMLGGKKAAGTAIDTSPAPRTIRVVLTSRKDGTCVRLG